LGLEYLQQTLEADQAAVLLESILQAFCDNSMETLVKTSDNLKSVSGLIGMQETIALACLNRQHDGLKDNAEKLHKVVANGPEEARKIASTCQRRGK
jgi:hypothetical protein